MLLVVGLACGLAGLAWLGMLAQVPPIGGVGAVGRFLTCQNASDPRNRQFADCMQIAGREKRHLPGGKWAGYRGGGTRPRVCEFKNACKMRIMRIAISGSRPYLGLLAVGLQTVAPPVHRLELLAVQPTAVCKCVGVIGGEAHRISGGQIRIDMAAAPGARQVFSFGPASEYRGLPAECAIAVAVTIAFRHGA
jgi:hypothetical protein